MARPDATPDPEALERELVRDLQSIAERLADERLSTEVYRALASRLWRKPGAAQGHVSLSWGRAEEIVNGLRAEGGHDALRLAQTGGEGEVSRTAEHELSNLGWKHAPLNSGRRDPTHVARDAQAPPRDSGARNVGKEPGEGLRRGHEDAERERERVDP